MNWRTNLDVTAERCEQVISDLKRISVQDAHRCFGCGREHNCSLHGCAILRDAVDLIQSLSARSAAKRTTIMPNDIVLHVPSGEKWAVCGVDHIRGELVPYGYPFPTIAQISDCVLLELCYEQMGQTREAAQELEKCGLHRFIDPCWLIAQAYDSAELYRESFDDLMSKGNCNNCVKKQWCGSAAKPGETVRANCPLYAAPAEEEANAEE